MSDISRGLANDKQINVDNCYDEITCCEKSLHTVYSIGNII